LLIVKVIFVITVIFLLETGENYWMPHCYKDLGDLPNYSSLHTRIRCRGNSDDDGAVMKSKYGYNHH